MNNTGGTHIEPDPWMQNPLINRLNLYINRGRYGGISVNHNVASHAANEIFTISCLKALELYLLNAPYLTSCFLINLIERPVR